MICKECGAYNPDHATYCKVCAANLKGEPEAEPAEAETAETDAGGGTAEAETAEPEITETDAGAGATEAETAEPDVTAAETEEEQE